MAAAAVPSVIIGIPVPGASHRLHLHKATARAQERQPPAAPFLLRVVVSASTQLLRILTNQRPDVPSSSVVPASCKCSPSQVQDVMDALMLDYQQAYFLTGKFTRTLYADHCYFADPTISFTGTDLYESNLKLLMPFLEEPSLSLFSLNKELVPEGQTISAVWRLRTYLKLPWRPLICIDGSTVYTLDENLMIVKHIESWAVSPFEAISQIFKRGDNI